MRDDIFQATALALRAAGPSAAPFALRLHEFAIALLSGDRDDTNAVSVITAVQEMGLALLHARPAGGGAEAAASAGSGAGAGAAAGAGGAPGGGDEPSEALPAAARTAALRDLVACLGRSVVAAARQVGEPSGEAAAADWVMSDGEADVTGTPAGAVADDGGGGDDSGVTGSGAGSASPGAGDDGVAPAVSLAPVGGSDDEDDDGVESGACATVALPPLACAAHVGEPCVTTTTAVW